MSLRRDFVDAAAGDGKLTVSAEHVAGDTWRVRVGDRSYETTALRMADGRLAFELDGRQHVAAVAPRGDGGGSMVRVDGQTFTLRPFRGRKADEAGGGGLLTAPMTGTLLAVHVAVGERVEPGRTVAVVSAMKMEHKLVASIAGTVVEVGAEAGQQVDSGNTIVRIEPDPAPGEAAP
ncbi:MAG: hypothetical protein IPM29_07565 [Planctomycetes bacterium]|nr:hypothetical protein [Planctomycetota bacterium]